MIRYTTLGRSGLRVSNLCLGTMSFGTQWGFGADEATSHQVLSAFADAGGTFLDTANKYHGGETETIVGNWLEGRDRDRFVLATKYTLSMDPDDPNSGGNQRKNLVRAVERSLERLGTDYIDLLWVHAWDPYTPLDETMRGLDDVIRSGMVNYIGISDAPAWTVSAQQVLAELKGWTPYVGLQIEYSLLERTVERELLPMAEHFGLSTVAWAPLGGGVLTGKYTPGGDNDSLRRGGNEDRGRTSERALHIARTVDAVADEVGASSAQVATAWVMHQHDCIPIVGARKVSQIEDTLRATEVSLTDDHLRRLDEVSRVSLDFPHEFLRNPGVMDAMYGTVRSRVDAKKARW